MKQYAARKTGTIDPFYLYLEVVKEIGQHQAFLLEAGREDDSLAYHMSLIGVCPLVEIQIKDGIVAVFAEEMLVPVFRELLDEPEDFSPERAEALGTTVWPSPIDSQPLLFTPKDPMAFLERIRAMLQRTCAPDMRVPFSAGFLGYVGYDGAHYLENLPKTTLDDRSLPDVRLQWHGGVIQLMDDKLTFYRQDDPAMFQQTSPSLSAKLDAVERVLKMAEQGMNSEPVALRRAKADAPVDPQIHYDVSEEVYGAGVRRAKDYIRQGDIFQVVLSTRMRIEGGLHPYAAYDALRRLNPSPYMFVAEYAGMNIFGASPEVQFRSIDGRAEMKPIAGTSRGRGASREEDEALVAALKSDEKEMAEHVMLVDLCRNDLGRVSQVGSVRVSDFMVVERYSHLYHLVSRVEGNLRPDTNVFRALLSTFPNGTLSGAPKIRAMEIIDELEPYRRGPYGGFIGMVDANANANTAIVIRTVVQVGETQYVQVGAGIVLDSDPAREWQECHHKAGAVLDVLVGAKRTPVAH